jgi:hypothetical protein
MLKAKVVDTDTGEEFKAFPVFARKNVDWSFIQLSQDGAKKLAANHDLSAASLRVFIWLCGSADHHCVVKATQGEIAEGIGISRWSVNAAVKVLIEQKYVEQVAVIGYGLNKDVVRRGGKK